MGNPLKHLESAASAMSGQAVRQSWVGDGTPAWGPLNNFDRSQTAVQARLSSVVSQLEELRRTNKWLQKDNERMHNELEAGARVQQALVPKQAPEVSGAEFAWRYAPCCELGGDILDVVRLDDHRVGIYLLDVSGHGTASALLSVSLSRLLSHMSDDSLLFRHGQSGKEDSVLTPAEVARCLNNRFQMDPDSPQYFTLVYGILDIESLEFRYVAAGHPGPLVLRGDDNAKLCSSSALAVGWFPDTQFEEATLQLRPGDRLYLFSDGVVDAEAPNGQDFDTGRLTRCLGSARSLPLGKSLDQVLEAVERWCDGQGPDDDVSLVAVEIPTHGKSAK